LIVSFEVPRGAPVVSVALNEDGRFGAGTGAKHARTTGPVARAAVASRRATIVASAEMDSLMGGAGPTRRDGVILWILWQKYTL
jgi:hypothetical protein